MDRYIDMNSISTIDRMIYRRRKAKEEKKDLGCKLFGESIDLELLLIEKEKGVCKRIKSKNFRQQKSKSKRN